MNSLDLKHQIPSKKERETREEIFKLSGARYVGEWIGLVRDGFGVQFWPDGSIYEGNWELDRACGIGKFYYANGDFYEGEWQDN